MAKDKSTQIRDFVKNSLATYYKNFQVKLDTPKTSDVNAAIKIKDGDVYVWGLGGYGESGYDIDNAITLQEIIHDLSNNIDKNDSLIQNINSSIQDLSNNKISNINADANIKVERNSVDVSISALGYTYNQEKDNFTVGDPTSSLSSSATGTQSFAEGRKTLASGIGAHTEGCYTVANKTGAHAEGQSSHAEGEKSHAEGYHTIARNEAEHAEGKYNISNTGTIHSVGIGSSAQSKNALEILNDGSIFITGLVTTNSYNGTSITNVSTLQEVINEKLDKSSAAAGLRYEVVQQLPTNPELSVIYLVPSTTSIVENVYDEKMYINNTWETIGSTATDLDNYYTKNETDAEIDMYVNDNCYTKDVTDELIENVSLKAGNNIEITQDNSINALGYTFINSPFGTEFNILPGRLDTRLKMDKSIITYNTQNTLGQIPGMVINSSNNIAIVPDNKIYLNAETECNNNVTAVAFYQSSDERLKNIKSELSVEDCYKLINDCSAIIYSLKTDDKDQNQIGMVAQQVKEIMPEVVQESNGYYSINYSRLSVVALNLIKNLSERIIKLEKDHNKLEELIKRVEKLEK